MPILPLCLYQYLMSHRFNVLWAECESSAFCGWISRWRLADFNTDALKTSTRVGPNYQVHKYTYTWLFRLKNAFTFSKERLRGENKNVRWGIIWTTFVTFFIGIPPLHKIDVFICCIYIDIKLSVHARFFFDSHKFARFVIFESLKFVWKLDTIVFY